MPITVRHFVLTPLIIGFVSMGLVTAQDLPKSVLGIYYMSGPCAGVNGPNTYINQQIQEYTNGFVQVGAYTFVYLKPDSSGKAIKYVKLDIGVASRTGTFDLNNGTNGIAKMTSTSIDITTLLPLSMKVSNGIDAYAAFGPMFIFRRFRNITTTQLPLPAEASTGSGFKFGFATELGFKFGNSAIGFRATGEFSDYPYRTSAIFLNIAPPSTKKRKK